MGYNCPECGRLIYNRRMKRCGYCGARIPEHMWLTKEQIIAIDEEDARLEERMKALKKRQKRMNHSSLVIGGGGIGDMLGDFDPGE